MFHTFGHLGSGEASTPPIANAGVDQYAVGGDVVTLAGAALDADYATSLAAIPDGAAKNSGITVGQEAAAGIIALRQGDGLEADIGFTMPAPAPGVWQLPTGVTSQTPWASKITILPLRD